MLRTNNLTTLMDVLKFNNKVITTTLIDIFIVTLILT